MLHNHTHNMSRAAAQSLRAKAGLFQKHAVPYDRCGKVIVASSQGELPRLEELYRRGNENGQKGIQMLTAEQIREVEPHVASIRYSCTRHEHR